MLTIRLQRVGKRHQPGYRVVVAPKRSKLGGPPVEDLGSYNPQSKKAAISKDRLLYWLGVGAKPSVTTHNLFVSNGLVSAPKLPIKMKKAKLAEAAPLGGQAFTSPGATEAASSEKQAAESAAEPVAEKTEPANG